MDMVFSPSYYQAGLGPLPSHDHLQNSSPTSHVVTPLPFPLIPSSAPRAAPPQRGPVTGNGQTHISPATMRTEKRGKARREKVSKSEKPRVECCFCKKLIQESGINRHVNRCKLNPDLVEITCPVCDLVLSRGDSLKRHLDSPTACPGSQSTTPASAPQLGPSRAARTNHRVSPYTPSPPSSASPATPNDSYEPSPTAKSTQSPQSSYTHYTNNHYARYMARQIESPPSVLSNHSSTPQYTTDQPSPHIYNGNDGPSPLSHNNYIPQSPPEHQYNALASTPAYSGNDQSWTCQVPQEGNQSWYTTTQLMLAAYSETTQAELANEEPVNVQSDHSPPEYMGSQTAASTPGNHEEYFPLSEYGFGDQAQYQDAVPYSAQEYQSPNNQPTPHADPSRPRTMLEELQSPFISSIGEDIYPSGEQATTEYESYSQSTFSLPTFQAASPQTLASEFSHGSAEGLVATHHAGPAATGEGISDEDMQAISSTLLSAVGGPMESHAILNFAMILANTDVPGSSTPQEAL